MTKNSLIGKTIQMIFLADDRKAIKFCTVEENIIVLVDGDCCSDTWIEHITIPALGLPAKVISVENLDLSDNDERIGEWGDVISHYGCKITTDKGEIIIDYRNSSNGYYGGNLVWPGDYHYGGVSGQNESMMVWDDPLTGDM